MSTTFQEVLIFLEPLIMLGQNEPNPKMPKWCNTTPKIWNGLLFKEDVEITRQKVFSSDELDIPNIERPIVATA